MPVGPKCIIPISEPYVRLRNSEAVGLTGLQHHVSMCKVLGAVIFVCRLKIWKYSGYENKCSSANAETVSKRNMVWSETEERRAFAARNCAGMYFTVLSVLYFFHFGKKYKRELEKGVISQ